MCRESNFSWIKLQEGFLNAGRGDDGAHAAQLLHRNSFLKELK